MKTRVISIFIFSLISFYVHAQKDYANKINQLNDKGQREGLWIDSSKYRIKETYHKNGIESGLFKQYNLKGRLLIFGEYCEGKMCGNWYYFGEYGHLIMVFKDFSTNTYPIISEGTGKKYIPDYKCYSISYYANGNIKDEGLLLWSEGEEPESDLSCEYGEWKYYDETGISCSKKIFDNVVSNTEKELVKYKVEKITKYGTVYIIELSKNDSIYRVLTKSGIHPMQISLLNEKIEECKTEKIEVGESYELQLDIFSKNELEENYVGSLDIQHYVEFNGTQILIKTGEILYTTKNLNGLCLIK